MPKFVFPSNIEAVKEAWIKVSDLLGDMNIDESTLFDIRLGLEEAVVNAIKHGNKYNVDLSVEIDVAKKEDRVEFIVRDQGDGFDIEGCADPTEDENLIKCSGRGVFLIKKMMDEVHYDKDDRCLHMVKKIKS